MTKYFVRCGEDPDYSDSTLREEFLYWSCFDNKVCLLLDGLADVLHFISVVTVLLKFVGQWDIFSKYPTRKNSRVPDQMSDKNFPTEKKYRSQ